MRILNLCLPFALSLCATSMSCTPEGDEPIGHAKTSDTGEERDASEDGGSAADVQSYCGDGRADRFGGPLDEVCDGDDLAGQSCEGLDLPPGRLACADNCAEFDTTMCVGEDVCGNGFLEGDEVCDEGAEPSLACRYGQTECEVCNGSCELVPGVTSTCGDGERDALYERCEGADLGGTTCEDLGYVRGELACDERCFFDLADCWRPICGDGVLDEGEACDDGDENVEWYCNPGDESCCRSDCEPGEPAPDLADDVVVDAGNPDATHDIDNGSDGEVWSQPDTDGEAGADTTTDQDDTATAGARPTADESGCAAAGATPGIAWLLFALVGLRRRDRASR